MSDAAYGFLALVMLVFGFWKAAEIIVKILKYVKSAIREERLSEEDEELKRKAREKLRKLGKKRSWFKRSK